MAPSVETSNTHAANNNHTMKRTPQINVLRMLGIVLVLLSLTAAAHGAEATELSQFGITWRFDRPCVVGQFVTGDYWVVGPVRIVGVSPGPGPAPEGDKTEIRKNQFGDAGLQDDRRMRNGSMIVLKSGPAQGYDSRPVNFNPVLSVQFPCPLNANESLISTISNPEVNVTNFVHALMWPSDGRGVGRLSPDRAGAGWRQAEPQVGLEKQPAGRICPEFKGREVKTSDETVLAYVSIHVPPFGQRFPKASPVNNA